MAGDNVFTRVLAAIRNKTELSEPESYVVLDTAGATREDFEKAKVGDNLPSDDTAWSELSMIYGAGDFDKYNPDELIGRKGFGIYKKMMQDEQVKAVVRFKRDAITSRDYQFVLDHEEYGLTEEEAGRRIKLMNHVVNKMRGSFRDGMNAVMAALYNGFSMTEKIFEQVEFDGRTYWGLEALKAKPFDSFYFNVDEYGNILQVTQKFGGKDQSINIEKFIHFVMNPDIDEHYGQSELREAYRAWFTKDVVYKFRNMWLERHAGGFRWMQPIGSKNLRAGTKEYNDLQAVMQTINTATGIILPEGIELNSDHPSNNVAYKEAIEDQDMAIARSLLVPNLLGISPQGDTGSFSQSTVQFEAFLWTLEADASRLEEALNEQLFRQLGEINFGDDAWPRFKFKQVSDRQMMEALTKWTELMTAGAIVRSDSDEEHIRKLLKFPPREEAEKVEEDDDTETSQTGAEDQESDSKKIEVEEPGQSAKEGTPAATIEEEAAKDSTIVGRGLVSVSAFTKALKRVDFAVIDKSSEAIIEEYTAATADVMGRIVDDLVTKAKEGGDVDEDIKDNMRQLKINPKLKQKMNRVQTAMLKEGYRMGQRHASNEIDKAKRTSFSCQMDHKRLDMIAEDYFRVKALKVTGDLSDEAIRLVENEILNGTKYGKTWKEIEESIYKTFATKGLISMEDAREALGQALHVENPDARLRTGVRTNVFDAVNTSRHDYFTDPDLEGFVIAYEYSAILDGRTTQICRHLDEEDAGNHTLEWYEQNPEFRPPNHYNCRSLLVPVTEADEKSFVEGPEPSIEPQEGFK